MLIALLDENIVKLIESGVNPDIDCYIDSEPLSIKTISYNGSIRLKWTSNAVKAKQFIDSYEPQSDILVVRIVWGKAGEVRLIPLSLQKQVFNQIGVETYLLYSGATNTRGVNLSPKAEVILNSNPESTSLPISWKRSNEVIDPIDKWVSYWRATQ